MVDRRIQEYWKDVAADDWRKVGQQIPDRGEVRVTAAGQEAYMSVAPRYADTHGTAVDHHGVAQRYIPANSRPSDQSSGPPADLPRGGWAVQHLLTDSYRHGASGSSGMELASRENRAAWQHYDMLQQQHIRKYPIPSADYGVSEIQYDRRQPQEALTVQTVGVLEAQSHYRRPTGSHPAPLQPVEPSVRPRIAGLTHGDPSPAAVAYEAALPQANSGRYSSEQVPYRSSRYDAMARPVPADALVPSDPKPVSYTHLTLPTNREV